MTSETSTGAPSSPGGIRTSIGRNTLFGIIANLAQVGTRLITVPIVIHHLGLGGYGIWNIIMLSATYMRFGSVGIKTAFQKYVAEATGNGDYENTNKLLSTGCAVVFAFSLAILIPAACFSHQIARLAGVPPEFLGSAAGAISLLALIMVMANVGAAFEAIVMGGHRIDLVRRFGTVLTIAEAITIVIALRMGYGLVAMAGTMGVSELIYVSCCYFASRRVVPQVRLSIGSVSSSVIYELFRFAGSFQLVNVLEVLYVSLVPLALLRVFGANAAGVYGVVTRVVASAGVLQEAFLPPILSAGATIYASGSLERMRSLVSKAFKTTITLSLLPMGFIALFGPTMAYAWTGQTDPRFSLAFWLVCSRAILQALSLLALVLYRVSGSAVLDNIRQVVRIVAILAIVAFAKQLGFYGVLGGMAFAELLGTLFMFFALTRTYRFFRVSSLLPDAARLALAAVLILSVAAIASRIPLPTGDLGGRISATLKLGEICLACLIVGWPLLLRTGSVTAAEGAAVFDAFIPRRRRDEPVLSSSNQG